MAADKIAGLLGLGAELVVVSPRAVQRIRNQVRTGALIWRRRAFREQDVEGAFLVIAATSSSRINEAVFQASKIRGILCNAADDPDHCDFFYPAIVRRASCKSQSPPADRAPRLPPASAANWNSNSVLNGRLVDHLGEWRCVAVAKKMSPATRKRRLLQIASPNAFRAFLRRQRLSGLQISPRQLLLEKTADKKAAAERVRSRSIAGRSESGCGIGGGSAVKQARNIAANCPRHPVLRLFCKGRNMRSQDHIRHPVQRTVLGPLRRAYIERGAGDLAGLKDLEQSSSMTTWPRAVLMK